MNHFDQNKTCCTPDRSDTRLSSIAIVSKATDTSTALPQAVDIPGGTGLVGTGTAGIPNDGETPLRKARLKPFRMSATTITNAQFQAFVNATDYITEAERFGWSFVFHAQVPNSVGATHGVVDVEWWRHVDGANWRDINGPATMSEVWHPDHPVVQISWNDARAYATWAGGRLPTEIEWEHAARGGLGDVKFPWGSEEPNDVNQFPCNIWQGNFPNANTGADGHLTTAPSKSFTPNGYGLFNMVGNVWEWTADAYTIKSLRKDVRARLAQMPGFKLSKGGSFLCHASYCYRYRIAARSGTSPDSAATHHGFRVVWDKKQAR